jgi:hypothetical protein
VVKSFMTLVPRVKISNGLVVEKLVDREFSFIIGQKVSISVPKISISGRKTKRKETSRTKKLGQRYDTFLTRNLNFGAIS